MQEKSFHGFSTPSVFLSTQSNQCKETFYLNLHRVSHFLSFLEVLVLLFCTLGDCWQRWRGGCASVGTRAESSLFLQADLPANTVRITNRLVFINRGFSKIYKKGWGCGGGDILSPKGECLY